MIGRGCVKYIAESLFCKQRPADTYTILKMDQVNRRITIGYRLFARKETPGMTARPKKPGKTNDCAGESLLLL